VVEFERMVGESEHLLVALVVGPYSMGEALHHWYNYCHCS